MFSLINPRHGKTKRIWSAGGIVCRSGANGGIEVLLVGRTYENLWALPKGSPEKGEPVEYTAVREVSEETGLEVQPIAPLRETSHTFLKPAKSKKKRNRNRQTKVYKTVHWYLMRATGGGLDLHDHEFDVVEWFPSATAYDMLTYGNERRLIEEAAYKFRKVLNQRDTVRMQRNGTTVRSKRFTDAWDDFQWRSDPELALLDASTPLAVPFDQFQRVFERTLNKRKPESLHLAIEDARGNHIGNTMCYDVNRKERNAEFGIMIGDREYWNRGHGTDAAIMLLQHAFETLPINNLFLHTLSSNSRAQSAFRKAGFTTVDVVDQGGNEFVRMEVNASDVLA